LTRKLFGLNQQQQAINAIVEAHRQDFGCDWSAGICGNCFLVRKFNSQNYEIQSFIEENAKVENLDQWLYANYLQRGCFKL